VTAAARVSRSPSTAALRIVSLLPSATEIVAALGLGEQLVGRSHECDFPPEVVRLPVCTAPKIDVSGSSRHIHEQIEALLLQGLSVYRVDEQMLRGLAPTHIVTQAHCEVCAVSTGDVLKALAGWPQPPRIVAVNCRNLDEVFAEIARLAECLGAAERGVELVENLRGRMMSVARRSLSLRSRPRVATIEWLSPLMAAGNWIPEMVEMAGGVNLFGESGSHSPWLDWESLRSADPDVIAAFPCGYSLDRSRAESEVLTALPGWDNLAAVRQNRVFFADGSALFNRPGPRLAETLEVLAQMVHPAVFGSDLHGQAFERCAPLPKSGTRSA
jgi:iron complex transport system substrate-binding protein